MDKANPVNTRQEGLRVLTIHGDGLQGLAIISVIDELCSRISQGSKSGKSQVPSQLFDIICGTGIGAFIATLFGRYHLDVPKCKQVYMDFSDYLEDRNASRRSSVKQILQEDVQNFLQALIRDEGWSDSIDFALEGSAVGSRHFVLASQLKDHGKSAPDVFHGANVVANALNFQKDASKKQIKASLRTAQAVAHPIRPSGSGLATSELVVTQHGQKVHELVSIAMRYARTFCNTHDITFMASIGPSIQNDGATSSSPKLPDFPGKWVAQKTSPITSPIKSMVMVTLKILKSNEHSQPVQEHRRAKSMSVMQWPIQGLGFSFDHPKSPVVEIKQEISSAAAPVPVIDIGNRLFSFDTAMKELTGSESDMMDLKETRVDIRHMISFMHASGLIEEAVSQYQSS